MEAVPAIEVISAIEGVPAMDSAVSINIRVATMATAAMPVLKTTQSGQSESRPLLESMSTSMDDHFDIAMTKDSANSALVTRWLERLMQHFGMHELETISDQSLATLLVRCGEDQSLVSQDTYLLSELRRRVVRLAGAQLDDAFLAMAPDIVAEDDIESISLSVESQSLKGIRYQNEVYRLVEAFEPCHRLQAFCLGQTLAEKALGETVIDEASLVMARGAYLITRSTERFAVWVNVRVLPAYRYPHHLSSAVNILDLAS